jgi:hypothetical protein
MVGYGSGLRGGVKERKYPLGWDEESSVTFIKLFRDGELNNAVIEMKVWVKGHHLRNM